MRRVLLILVFVMYGLVHAPRQLLSAMPPAAARSPSIIPDACVTKTRILPRVPGWVFALNFEKFGAANAPIACLMLYRVVSAPTDFIEVPCKTVGIGDDVTFGEGRARFDGGYIFCGVNIKQQLAALTPPVEVPDVQTYPYFTIVAVGAFSATIHTDPQSNPIGYYRPDTTTVPGLGLYVPLLANARQVRSEFNDVANISVDNTLQADKPYTFTVEHDGGPTVYTTTHYLDDAVLGAFAPREPVNFYTNGGAFWIGVNPRDLSLTFTGTLDEVIFDPPDGARPPTTQREQHLVFAPLTIK